MKHICYRCEICGVELKEVDGSLICPNHGIVNTQEEVKDTEKSRGYIG